MYYFSLALVPYDEAERKRKSSKEKKPATKKTWRGRLLPTDEKPWRKQKFIDKWVEDEKFKGWLARHPEDPTLAKCTSCNQELVAGKSELIKHSQTRKHIKSLQTFDGSTIDSDSTSVKNNNAAMFLWVLNDQECQPPTTEVKVMKNERIMIMQSNFYTRKLDSAIYMLLIDIVIVWNCIYTYIQWVVRIC